MAEFDQVEFEWVPRAENSHADRLANEAMDAAAEGREWQAPDAAGQLSSPPPQESGGSGPDDVLDDPMTQTTDTDTTDTTPTWQDPAAALPHPRDGEPTRFVIVRHGETTWGAQARFAGRKDVSLTPRGRRQAAAVAGRIRDLAPVAVLTSPLQRCRNTAQAIAAEVGAPVLVDDRLIDGMLGDWTGFPGRRDRGAMAAGVRPPGGRTRTRRRPVGNRSPRSGSGSGR